MKPWRYKIIKLVASSCSALCSSVPTMTDLIYNTAVTVDGNGESTGGENQYTPDLVALTGDMDIV